MKQMYIETENEKDLDSLIKKANRFVELLREAKQIIDSLSGRRISAASINIDISDTDSYDVINEYVDRITSDLAAALEKNNVIHRDI